MHPCIVLSFRALLLLHGYVFLFGYILAVQAGAPAPADPLLLIMGALSADHFYSPWIAWGGSVLAAMIADLMWFELGRRRGHKVLALICKLSLEPESCIETTEAGYLRRGPWTLLFAKFIPGMNLVSVPLAGAFQMPRSTFILADAGGAALWSGTYLLAGHIFHRQVNQIIQWLGLFGRRAGLIALLIVALYIGIKYLQRWRFRRELRINRLTPEAAMEMILSRRPVTIVDLRRRDEVERVGEKIADALVLRPLDLRSRAHKIPPEHEVILYCS